MFLIITIAIILKLTAVVVILRFAFLAEHKLPWILLAGALFLMSARRAVSLYIVGLGTSFGAIDYVEEWLGLASSLFLLIAVVSLVMFVDKAIATEKALLDSEATLRVFADYAYDWEYWIDSDGKMLSVVPSCERITGYSAEEFRQNPDLITQIMHPEDSGAYAAHLQTISPGPPHVVEARIITKSGEEKWIGHVCQAVFDADGNFIGRRGSNRDITDRKKAEQELVFLSTRDVLTGLHNRRFFEEEMRRLENGRAYPITVLMADVNNLKRANGMYGHAAGDDLLTRSGRVLETALRAEDVTARVGGDEFAALLPATDQSEADEIIQRIRDCLKTDNEAHPEAPLSLALGYHTALAGQGLVNALKAADDRMYNEKKQDHRSS